MASTSLKRGSPLEALWDHCKHKILGLVLGGHHIGSPKSTTYCKVYCGRTVLKLGSFKKSEDPCWNELFYVEPDEREIIKVEVWEEKRLSDSFLGEVNLGTVAQLAKEKVLDGWYPLVGKKDQTTTAKIHLRLYYSTMPGTAPDKGYYHHAFMYQDVRSRMKAGDLIGYSGTGVVAACTKVQTNCEYSSLGVIVQLANKWTGEPELYVAEVDRTRGAGVIDALADKQKDGVCVFRLFERIHAFHGKAIWWVPRKEALTVSQMQQLASFAVRAHADPMPFQTFTSTPIGELMQSIGLVKDPMDLVETYSAFFIASMIKHVDPGAVQAKARTMTPVAIASLPLFDRPVLIRKMTTAPKASSIIYQQGESSQIQQQEVVRKSSDCELRVLSTSKYARLTESEERNVKAEERNAKMEQQEVFSATAVIEDNRSDEIWKESTFRGDPPPPFEESEEFYGSSTADQVAPGPLQTQSIPLGSPQANAQQTPANVQQELFQLQQQLAQMQMQMQMQMQPQILPYGSPYYAIAMQQQLLHQHQQQSIAATSLQAQPQEAAVATDRLQLQKVLLQEPPRQATVHQLEIAEVKTATL